VVGFWEGRVDFLSESFCLFAPGVCRGAAVSMGGRIDRTGIGPFLGGGPRHFGGKV